LTESETEKVYDCTVIGCGPAGASAALYLARAKLKTLVLDKSPSSGALASCTRIENYPGVPDSLSGAELIERMRRQAERFGAECERAQVLSVTLDSDPKQVITADEVHKAWTVILATGAMDRRVKFPGEERLLGRGVSYCATCDAAFFEGKECALVGDGEEALEEALLLTRFAAKVYFVSPKRELRGPDDLVQMVEEYPKIEVIKGAMVSEILGRESVEGVKLASPDGKEMTLAVHGVFLLVGGGAPTTGFLANALPLGEGGCLVVNHEQATVVSGVFAAGDVTCDHVKQAVIAAAEGVMAALAVDKHLNRRKSIRMDYR